MLYNLDSEELIEMKGNNNNNENKFFHNTNIKIIIMPFKEGNQYGKLTKRGENRVTKEVKQKLANLLDDTINSIDPDDLRIAQKIKLLEICLTYAVPKMVYKHSISENSNQKVSTNDSIDVDFVNSKS